MATTKTINTNKNDYARSKTKKGERKNAYPFNVKKVEQIKQSSNQ